MTETERSSSPARAGLGAAVAVGNQWRARRASRRFDARGYWEQVWSRFKRDKVAVASGIFIILLIVAAFVGAPIAKHRSATARTTSSRAPVDPPTSCRRARGRISRCTDVRGHRHATALHPRRGDGHARPATSSCACSTARRSRSRLRILATFGVMVIGVLMGSIAGYYRGWIDTVISRVTEITMAFPVLLFVIALAARSAPGWTRSRSAYSAKGW